MSTEPGTLTLKASALFVGSSTGEKVEAAENEIVPFPVMAIGVSASLTRNCRLPRIRLRSIVCASNVSGSAKFQTVASVMALSSVCSGMTGATAFHQRGSPTRTEAISLFTR